jgi:glycosyltransferase involved in cell wall biosynthesis
MPADVGSVELSVVVPFHDAGPHLAQQLSALARQEFDGGWEVMAVDDASSDGSRRIAESFSDRLNLRVIATSRRRGQAHARNLGARAAAGEKLLFVDADDEVAPGYLAAMSKALEAQELVAARLDHETLNPTWVRSAYGLHWQQTGVDAYFRFLPFAGGCALGVSRRVFESVGGFREELSPAEDVAFSWDVQLAGTALHFVADAVLRYRYRDTLCGLFRQTRRQGSVTPLLYKRYREMGMERRIALTAWLNVLGAASRARTKADLAPVIVQLGYRVGRLAGSVRYRVLYL